MSYVFYGEDYDFRKVAEYFVANKHTDLFEKPIYDGFEWVKRHTLNIMGRIKHEKLFDKPESYDNFEKYKQEIIENEFDVINSWDSLTSFLEIRRNNTDIQINTPLSSFRRLCDLLIVIYCANKLRNIDVETNPLKLSDMQNAMVFLDINRYTDFITSPASTKYHGNYVGGLFDHSLAVYEAALRCAEIYGIRKENVDVTACIFHDLCKVGRYKQDEDGNFTYDRGYSTKSIAHGSESLFRMMELGATFTVGWKLAVNYHMGAFTDSNEERNQISKITESHPEVLLLHHADMIATKIYKI